MTQIMIPNEITSALIADKCRYDDNFMQRMQTDGAETLASLLDASASDIKMDVLTIQNTADVVHVALPHYAGLEGSVAQSKEKISDDDLARIAGGEIVTIIAAIATVSLIGTIVVGGSIALGIHYSNEANS